MLLAVIDSAVNIWPQEAEALLGDLINSNGKDIVDAAYEALSMAEMLSDDESDKDEFPY